MDKISIENEKKLLDTINLIEQIAAIGKSALNKFHTNSYDLIVFARINYLERFTHNFEAINILLREYKDKPNIETSIGLTIRASLLDFITIAYLDTYIMDGNQAKVDEVFEGLIADQMHNTIKYLKLSRDTGLITNEDYKKAIENCWYTYNFFFIDKIVDYDNPEKKLISSKLKSPTQYFKRIQNHSGTKPFSKAYDLYTYYSKYEHFGILTHFMQRQGINNNFETMMEAMRYMILGIGACFTFLNETKNLIIEKQRLEILKKDFNNLCGI